MNLSGDIAKHNTTCILEELVLAYQSKDNSRLEQLLNKNSIDWSLFIDQSIKHKLLPLAWVVLNRCENFEEKIPFYIREFMSNFFLTNKYRIGMYKKNINLIAKILNDNNINFAMVKGLVLESLIYNNDNIKVISDIDILIDISDYDKVCNLLEHHNITSGKYDYRTFKVNQHDRKKELFYRLTKDHLPDHVIETNDINCPVIKIDISTNCDWIERNKTEMLKGPRSNLNISDSYLVNILDHTSNFVYMALHLHRHAWSYRFIERNISIRMSMFNDLVMYWNVFKHEIKKYIHTFLEDKAIYEKIAWVGHHTDDLYKTSILEELNLKFDVNQSNKAFGKQNIIISWNGNIRDRLWSSNEKDLFTSKEYNYEL